MRFTPGGIVLYSLFFYFFMWLLSPDSPVLLLCPESEGPAQAWPARCPPRGGLLPQPLHTRHCVRHPHRCALRDPSGNSLGVYVQEWNGGAAGGFTRPPPAGTSHPEGRAWMEQHQGKGTGREGCHDQPAGGAASLGIPGALGSQGLEDHPMAAVPAAPVPELA